MKLSLLTTLVAATAVAACTPLPIPDWKPTQEEVPFLGQKLSQAQLDQWMDRVQQQRTALQQKASAERTVCYQRFFVNHCLEQSRAAFLRQDFVLRKQELELNRQQRVLNEEIRQQRVRDNLSRFPAAIQGH